MPSAVTLLLLSLSFAACPTPAQTGAANTPTDQLEAYHTAVDQVFARPSEARRARVIVVLRFLPSFQPEEEIVLMVGSGQGTNVVTYKAKGSIWRKLQEANRTGEPLNLLAVAASVSVERKQFAVPDPIVRNWVTQLLNAVDGYSKYVRSAVTGSSRDEDSVSVDGVLYNLIVQTPQGDLTLERSAPGTLDQSQTEDPVASAMRVIRDELSAVAKER